MWNPRWISRFGAMAVMLSAPACESALQQEEWPSFPSMTPPACAKRTCADYWNWINYQNCLGVTFNAMTCKWSGQTTCTSNADCAMGVCDKSCGCCVASCAPKPTGAVCRYKALACNSNMTCNPPDRNGKKYCAAIPTRLCTRSEDCACPDPPPKLQQGDFAWFGAACNLSCGNWDSTMCVWNDIAPNAYCIYNATTNANQCSNACNTGGFHSYECGGKNCSDTAVVGCSAPAGGLPFAYAGNCGCQPKKLPRIKLPLRSNPKRKAMNEYGGSTCVACTLSPNDPTCGVCDCSTALLDLGTPQASCGGTVCGDCTDPVSCVKCGEVCSAAGSSCPPGETCTRDPSCGCDECPDQNNPDCVDASLCPM